MQPLSTLQEQAQAATRAAIHAREAEDQARRKLVEAQVAAIREIGIAALHLFPAHDRTSCSDDNPCNSEKARCNRCFLQALLAGAIEPDEIAELSFSLTATFPPKRR